MTKSLSLYFNGLVENAERGVRSAECGVRSAERGVRSAECGVRSAECGVRSVLFTVANHFNIGLRIFHRAGGLGGKRGVCLKTFVYGCKPF